MNIFYIVFLYLYIFLSANKHVVCFFPQAPSKLGTSLDIGTEPEILIGGAKQQRSLNI